MAVTGPAHRRARRWPPRFATLRLLVLAALCLPSCTGAATGAKAVRYTGVNLAGGEFRSRRIPGIRNKDYTYPRAADLRPFAAAGMNAVRVPVLWERLQPQPFGDLREEEMAALDKAIAALQPMAALVIVDIHDYGRRGGVPLTDPAAPAGALADLWRRLAARYAARPAIAFGLMNEPHDMPAPAWRRIVDDTVAAIRRTGARNLILVDGVDWSGAHSWPRANAAAFAGFRDPADNSAFDMHQYLDADSSGTKGGCPDAAAGPRRLAAATGWLRRERQRGFIGEFGTPPDEACLRALDGMLTYVDRNADVWLGWTYWAAGAWWGGYPLSVQPDRTGEKPQMRILRQHPSQHPGQQSGRDPVARAAAYRAASR